MPETVPRPSDAMEKGLWTVWLWTVDGPGQPCGNGVLAGAARSSE
jgi:hypothetical protein